MLVNGGLTWIQNLGIGYTPTRWREARCLTISEMKWKSLSHVWLFVTPWTIQSMEFSRQDTEVGSLSLLQGIFPIQGSNSGLLHCRGILYQLSHQGSLHPAGKPPPSREATTHQGKRWLDGITNSMGMSLSKFWSWWWTGRSGVLQSMGLQRAGHNWATELNWRTTRNK